MVLHLQGLLLGMHRDSWGRSIMSFLAQGPVKKMESLSQGTGQVIMSSN